MLRNEVKYSVCLCNHDLDQYDKLIEDGLFPIARWGTPEDVANAVSALVSDKFMYTTGNYIDVDGGFHIKRL